MNSYRDKSRVHKKLTNTIHESKKQSDDRTPFQFVDNRPEAVTQRRLVEMIHHTNPQTSEVTQLQANVDTVSVQQQEPIQKKDNNTGLPDTLKTGIEHLSGMSMDDVKVHRNSDKPAQLQAHAYAQGTDIHLGPGQEKHLPHEAWHVVQQKQGRVKPTMQMKGKVNINDDAGLEKEADVMGAKALNTISFKQNIQLKSFEGSIIAPIQLVKWLKEENKLVNANNPEIEYTGDAKKPDEMKIGDIWDDETNQVTSYIERTTVASKKDHEALIRQFSNLSDTGGLLMHAVATGEEVNSLEYLIEQGIPLSEIRMGEYRTKLLSYIRADLTMKTFAFRKFGLLVDWKRIWDVIGFKNNKATVYEEDQQSSRSALDDELSYGESIFANRLLTKRHLGLELHEMALRQNALKQKGNIGNWNEILSHNAITAGVIGLLWVQEESKPTEDNEYNLLFTPEKKRELFQLWKAKTGMNTMPIYIYTHMGNPIKGTLELDAARERLGTSNASSLKLKEVYSPPDEEKKSPSSSLGLKDIVTIDGHRFSPQVEGIRDTGQCFWDTLKSYKIDTSHLERVAVNMGIQFNDHFDAQNIAKFLNELSEIRGSRYQIILHTINIFNGQHLNSVTLGERGGITMHIALFLDTDNGVGHYVPEI